MSVDQRMVIDAIGTTRTGRCSLTISDHLPWDDPNHLQMLQDKMNDYLDYIQSGQLFEDRPDARNRELGIELICKFYPDTEVATSFLEIIKPQVLKAKIVFRIRNYQT